MHTFTQTKDTNTWKRQAQVESLPGASHRYEVWLTSELEFVTAFPDATSDELAAALGRTVYAVHTIRARLAAGPVIGADARPARPAYRGWMEGDGDGDE